MRKERLKRFLSSLLAAAIVVGLLPALPGLLIPTAAAAAETDAYGFELSQPEDFNPDDDKNPYGTGKFNFNPVTELNVYEGGEREQKSSTYDLDTVNKDKLGTLFSGAKNSTLQSELNASWQSSSNAKLGYTNAVAFDPTGSGRDDYVMYYGFDTNNHNIPSTIFAKAGETLQKAQAAAATTDDNGKDDSFQWVNNLDQSRGTGYTAITAGDFDGDGYESVIYYVPGDTHRGGRMTLQEQTFDKNGSMSDATKVLDVGTDKQLYFGDKKKRSLAIIQQYGDHTPDSSGADMENVKRNTAMMHLTAADLDGDERDELIATISLGNLLDEGLVDDRSSRLVIMDYEDDDWKITFSQQLSGVMAVKSDNSTAGTYYLRSASTKAGDIDGNDALELVTLGSAGNHKSNNSDTVNGSFELAIITRYTEDGYEVETRHNDETNTDQIVGHVLENETSDHYVGYWYEDASIAPQSLALVAFDGFGTQEYIVARGKVFRYNTDGTGIELLNVEKSVYSPYDSCYHIGDPIVGNFDGNAQGREQVFFMLARGKGRSDNRIGGLWYTPNENNADDKGLSTEDGLKQLKSTSRKVSFPSGWKHNMLCLVAVDADTSDGMIAEYKDKDYTYTDPEVMAIMEASPYFSDLADEYPDMPGTTSFGLGRGSGSGESETTHVQAGAYFGFEKKFSVLGVEVASFEMEVAYQAQWDNEYEQTLEETVEMNYDSGPYQNQVVLVRTPVIVYHYTVWDTEGNPSEMHVTSAQTPVYAMMPLDAYNDVAKEMGGDMIGTDVISCEPGVPSSYRSSMSQFGSKAKAALSTSIAASSGTGGSTTLSVTREETDTVTHSLTHDISTKIGGGGGGYSLGATVGGGWGSGEISMDISSVTQAGTVAQIPEAYEQRYGFNWNLVTWDTTLGSGEDSYTVPVVSYLVTNVKEPAPVPQNVYAESHEDGEAIDIKWQSDSSAISGFEVYRYQADKPIDYFKIGEVKGDAGKDGVFTFTDTSADITPGKMYQYSVRARGTDGSVSNYSAPVTVWTASGNTIKVTKQPDDATVLPGGTAEFSAWLYLPEGYTTTMNWQVKEANSTAWVNITSEPYATLTLRDVSSAMSGNQYRLLAQTNDGSYLYTKAATLTVGKVESNTEVSAAVNGITTTSGQANYIEQKTENEQVNVNSVYRLNNTDYTRYENARYEQDGSAPEFVYLNQSDGQYYLLEDAEFTLEKEGSNVYVSSDNVTPQALTSLADYLIDGENNIVTTLDKLHSTIQTTQDFSVTDEETTGEERYNVFTAQGYAVSADKDANVDAEADKTTLTLYQKEESSDYYVLPAGSEELTPVTAADSGDPKNLTYIGEPAPVWSTDSTETTGEGEDAYAIYAVTAKIGIPAPSACSLGTTLPEFQPHFHALKPQCLIIGLAQPYCD